MYTYRREMYVSFGGVCTLVRCMYLLEVHILLGGVCTLVRCMYLLEVDVPLGGVCTLERCVYLGEVIGLREGVYTFGWSKQPIRDLSYLGQLLVTYRWMYTYRREMQVLLGGVCTLESCMYL